MRGAISGAAGGAVGGAVAGGLGAAIYGANIGQGMLMGAGIGAAVGGIMGAIGGSLDGTENASPMQKMYTENPAFTRASWDGLKVDLDMFQTGDPDPNAFSVCTRSLAGKGGMAGTAITGKPHVFLWDGPRNIGHGLTPLFDFGFDDYLAQRFVVGYIKQEASWGTGCSFLTSDPARMANLRSLITEASRYYHSYNYPLYDCSRWVNDMAERSLSMPRGL